MLHLTIACDVSYSSSDSINKKRQLFQTRFRTITSENGEKNNSRENAHIKNSLDEVMRKKLARLVNSRRLCWNPLNLESADA